jgi:hypothetical protein
MRRGGQDRRHTLAFYGRVVSVVLAAFLQWVPLGTAAAMSPVGDRSFERERVLSTRHDDWEPTVATDRFGHVYWMTTRYGGSSACGRCPQVSLIYKISQDGGRTWGRRHYLCACPGVSSQNDPEIVTDHNGRVFAAWMNNYHVKFARSDDFGRTWSNRVPLDRGLNFSDKPTIAVSASGQDVYVVYNGPTAGDPYAVYSHDAGDHWSRPIKITASKRYFFSGGSTVLPNGTVLVAQDIYHQDNRGHIGMAVLRSIDGGRHWGVRFLGWSHQAGPCPRFAGCPANYAFLGEQANIASDAAGRAYFVYGSSTRRAGPARLMMRVSPAGGVGWGPRRNVAKGSPKADHEFPMIAATGFGDVRIAWMDDRTGRWNTFYKRSVNGGTKWIRLVRLSNRNHGAPYKSPRGFRFPYGDYGTIVIGAHGRTLATWAEAPSFIGPGNTWFTRQR